MPASDRIVNSETAILNVFNNQFPTLTDQIINNLYRLSRHGDRWPAVLLVVCGALLLAVSLVLKVGYFIGRMSSTLRSEEFITLIFAGSGLLLFGALFSIYQARSLRKIIQAQQLVGTEILNKQIEVEREVITHHQKHQQMGQLLLLPSKKARKRWRRC
ncbi:MAG TPA: hypothetical protein VF659_08020 [Pyrinomonadaceae bacterium]|jgi:protein-S-isoprenylcysteine O-methyltransferase Ste14